MMREGGVSWAEFLSENSGGLNLHLLKKPSRTPCLIVILNSCLCTFSGAFWHIILGIVAGVLLVVIIVAMVLWRIHKCKFPKDKDSEKQSIKGREEVASTISSVPPSSKCELAFLSVLKVSLVPFIEAFVRVTSCIVRCFLFRHGISFDVAVISASFPAPLSLDITRANRSFNKKRHGSSPDSGIAGNILCYFMAVNKGNREERAKLTGMTFEL